MCDGCGGLRTGDNLCVCDGCGGLRTGDILSCVMGVEV